MSSDQERVAHSHLGPFTYEVRALPTPNVGTDFVVTVPAGEVWRVVSLRATLVTSAAAATRDAKLIVDDQTTISASYAAGATQITGLTVVYNWLTNYPILMAAAEQGLVDIPLAEVLLQPGWRMRSAVGNIDVGDQWSGITVTAAILRRPPRTQREYLERKVEEAALEEMIREGVTQ